MNYIQGTPRDQLFLFNSCLENIIKEDHIVRIMEAYIESLDLKKLGFRMPELRCGKPPYRNQLLLKIYVYCYFERIRTSRRMEKECNRNQELI